MDNENDFLVTLPSNSNMQSNPENEPANYTVQLPTPLSLKGLWEVALVSVQYSHIWLSSDDAPIELRFILLESTAQPDRVSILSPFNDTELSRSGRTVMQQLTSHSPSAPAVLKTLTPNIRCVDTQLTPRYYENAQELGDHICKAFSVSFPYTKTKLSYIFDYQQGNGRFVNIDGEVIILTLDKRLGNMLGHQSTLLSCDLCGDIRNFNNQHGLSRLTQENLLHRLRTRSLESGMSVRSAEDVTKLNLHHFYHLNKLGSTRSNLQTVSSLWVYTDITENQIVGNSKVPLLGIVPVERSEYGSRTHHCVNPVHFLGLNRNEIREISIKIANEFGNRILFNKSLQNNNVVCCLRFRRRKSVMPI